MAGEAAFGVTVTFDPAGTPAVVAELTGIGGPSISAGTIDVSSHDSWKQAPAIATCTFTNATDIVNAVAHGLLDDEPVRFSTTGALPAELSGDRWYYVVNRAADTFQVSLTSGGAVHGFTDDGTGTHSFHRAYAYREFAAGIIDAGEVTLEGNFTTVAAADVLIDALEARTEVDVEIEFPTADDWRFDAIITAFSTDAPYEDKLAFSATLKVIGRPVLS